MSSRYGLGAERITWEAVDNVGKPGKHDVMKPRGPIHAVDDEKNALCGSDLVFVYEEGNWEANTRIVKCERCLEIATVRKP